MTVGGGKGRGGRVAGGARRPQSRLPSRVKVRLTSQIHFLCTVLTSGGIIACSHFQYAFREGLFGGNGSHERVLQIIEFVPGRLIPAPVPQMSDETRAESSASYHSCRFTCRRAFTLPANRVCRVQRALCKGIRFEKPAKARLTNVAWLTERRIKVVCRGSHISRKVPSALWSRRGPVGFSH